MMEAIIACGIIATAVSSSLTLVQASISAEKESESGIIATNLAREGVEVVRARRDSNWLSGDPWDQGLEGVSYDHTAVPVFSANDNSWSLDFAPNDMSDPMARIYRFTTGTGSAVTGLMVQAPVPPDNALAVGFSRLLTIDSICDNSGTVEVIESGATCSGEKIGLRVRSAVNFRVAGRVRELEIEESLYNWR